MHSDYIEVFKDSLTIAESPILRDETAQMVRSTVVFAEDYRAFLSPAPKKGALRFLRLTTLQAARLLTPPCAEAPGRVAVLNFANPV